MNHSHNHHGHHNNHSHEHNDHTGHDQHAGHSTTMFKDKFWLSLLLTIPVIIYSPMVQQWLKFTPPNFTGSAYIPFVFSTIIFLYGGLVFIKSAIGELKARLPGMMTLISLAIITAYFYSVAALFITQADDFFWELATLVTIMLLGHWLEMASVVRAGSALDAIAKLLPDKADKLVNKKIKTVLVSELKVNNLVLVRPGGRIPADGVVTDGESSVNEAPITGESQPVDKTSGDQVIAGTINQDGSLTVKVTKLGDDTALAGIMRLITEAQNSKSKAQMLADKAAFALTITAVLSALASFAYWLIAKDVNFALERAVTVLIIACPHALGLAIPLVVSISTTLSAKNGLLIRRRLALETARNIDWVLFDKTGTLTRGDYGVVDIWAENGYTTNDILRLAASLEQNSEHIIGRSITQHAKQKKLKLTRVVNFKALPGMGVQASLGDGRCYTAASHRYIVENNLTIPPKMAPKIKQAAKQGKTEVYLIVDKQIIGALALADILRPQSKPAIKTLHDIGIKVAMLTGDSREVATYVAKQLKLDEYFAEVRPEEKAARVKELQATGQRVAMVGDGVNDAPALAQADIGVAIGAGTDVAIKSADIMLTKSNPEDVIKIIKLSRATYRKMQQNLVWATGYNVLALPVAAGAFYRMGIVLAPALGAVLMSISTIVVAFNAQLLRRVNLKS